MASRLRLVIPSAGALYDGTLRLLAAADAQVSRVNTRRYTATIPSLPGIEVIYQRQSDITMLLDRGHADLGILGRDRYLESRQEDGVLLMLASNLGYGRSKLQIAVEDAWTETRSIHDLADVASDLNERGRPIRIATKYPRLVRRFLQRKGIAFFDLVEINGALEAAPRIGFAEAIADISDTGNTLRENNLRPLIDGTVAESNAILVGNAKSLAASQAKLATAKSLLERIEANLNARDFRRVTANVRGDSEDAVAKLVLQAPELAGMTGPTVSRVWTSDDSSWFGVQVVVRKNDVQRVVDHLRGIGGASSAVTEVPFLYPPRCVLYSSLLANLDKLRAAGEI